MASKIAPKVSGIFDSAWHVIEDQTLTANASAVTFSNLDGDAAFAYRLICVYTAQGTLHAPAIRLNGDTGANYDHFVSSLGASYSGTSSLGENEFAFGQGLGAGAQTYAEVIIRGTSGISPGHFMTVENRSNISPSGQNLIVSGEWNDTSALTTIALVDVGVSGLYGAGGRFILMELR